MTEARDGGTLAFDGPAPVFVIGSPRSGTTVFAWALGQHPQLWTGGEFHLLWRLFGSGRLEDLVAKELEFYGVLRRVSATPEDLLAHLGSGVVSFMSQHNDGRRWIDQTPVNTLMAQTLSVMFPTARFVHLLRDGPSAVDSMIHFSDAHSPEMRASLKKSGFFPDWATDFKRACEVWNESVEAAMAFAAARPDRCRTLRYERLRDDPDELFVEVLDFLGCPPDSAPARYTRNNRINSSFQDGASPSRPRPPAFQTWSDDQRKTFERIAGPTMKRWVANR